MLRSLCMLKTGITTEMPLGTLRFLNMQSWVHSRVVKTPSV